MTHREPEPTGGGRTPVVAGLVATAVLVLSLAALGVATRSPGSESAARQAPTTPSTSAPAPAPVPRAEAPSDSTADVGCRPAAAIASLPLRTRLAQLLIVGVSATGTAEALSVVRAAPVGGIFLTGDGTDLLTGGSLQQVQDAAQIPLIVAVDDEGGRVQRIATLAGDMPSARTMAATMTPAQVYRLALQRGRALARRGVTMNFAPVVDVSYQPDNAVIGDRSFSSNPRVVTRYASAFAQGMRDAGIMPVLKHFPGHGRTEGDSHQRAVTTPPLAALRRVDLIPYRQLLGDPGKVAVMLGHLQVPGLTRPGVPASLSPDAVSLLRTEFGFNGLVITDDLYAMDAIRDRYTVPEATRMALAAGADMALMISADRLDAVLDHLEAAVAAGRLPEARVNEAVARVLRTKDVNPCALESVRTG